MQAAPEMLNQAADDVKKQSLFKGSTDTADGRCYALLEALSGLIWRIL